jgi:hypothetical protein
MHNLYWPARAVLGRFEATTQLSSPPLVMEWLNRAGVKQQSTTG